MASTLSYLIPAIRFILLLELVVFLAPPKSFAAHEATTSNSGDKIYDTFTLYWENDAFAGTDRDYSSGLKFTWSTPFDIDNGKGHLPDWAYPLINSLPFVNDPGSHRAASLSAGQMIFTPEDIDRPDLIADDRPYAAYFYLASGLHNRIGSRKNSWEFQLGVVGPLALGEESQNTTHDLLGGDKAEGWGHQLGNEITLEIICESQWRLFQSETPNNFDYDLIPHAGFRFGNVQIYANAGAEIRYGWNLPKNFGSCPIRAGCATNSAFQDTPIVFSDRTLTGWHFFAAVDGRAVAHDIFLDGNTFRDSHGVDREVFVADLMAGLAMDFGHIKTTYSYILRTKQFTTEKENQIFGSLTFAWVY